MKRRRVVLACACVMMVGVVLAPVVTAQGEAVAARPSALDRTALVTALFDHRPVRLLLRTTSDDWRAALRQSGGQILWQSRDWVSVRVPPGAAPGVFAWPGVAQASVLGGVHAAFALDPDLPAQNNAQATSEGDAAASLHSDVEEMDLSRLANQGADGTGTVIAVVDTGADPLQPTLLQTTAGTPKIIDFQDFTGTGSVAERARQTPGSKLGEGDVLTTATAAAKNGVLELPNGPVTLGSAQSLSGIFHYGYLQESQVAGAGQDLNHNGVVGDRIPVVVTDSNQAGTYDTVWVDTNGNGDLSDEQPLHVYQQAHDVVALGGDGQAQTGLVVTALDSGGGLVDFGFDSNGHGTAVATIAAGNDGVFRGVAPGAQLMVLKALDGSGNGTWDNLSRAVLYAVQHGAKVVSLSVEGTNARTETSQAAISFLADLSQAYDAVIVLAAGNGGPGLISAGANVARGNLITVGASISPASWQALYGLRVPQETVRRFSAVGPSRLGGLDPDVVAPGAALAGVPTWIKPQGFDLFEGTSVATPHVAGLAAALWGWAQAQGLTVDAGAITQALTHTARAIPGFQPVEQGHGLVDGQAAWTALQAGWRGIDATWQVDTPELAQGDGVLDLTGHLRTPWLQLSSNDINDDTLTWQGLPRWLSLDRQRLLLPAGATRRLRLDLRPLRPGLHSALLEPQATQGLRWGPSLLVTQAVPYPLDPAHQWQATATGQVQGGFSSRQYFALPQGLTQVRLTINVASTAAAKAFLRAYLYGPTGELLWQSALLGGLGSTEGDLVMPYPQAGTWELVLAAPPGTPTASFQVRATAAGVAVQGLTQSGRLAVQFPGTGPQSQLISLRVTTFGNMNVPTAQGTGSATGPGTPPLTARYRLGLAKTETLSGGLPFYRQIQGVPSNLGVWQVTATALDDQAPFLRMELYRRDPSTGMTQQVARSQENGKSVAVTLIHPQAGDYVLWVQSLTPVPRDVRFTLTELRVPAGNQVQPAALSPVASSNAVLSPTTYELPVMVTAPAATGRAWGAILLSDGAGRVVSAVPVSLDRNLPALDVKLAAAQFEADVPSPVQLFVKSDGGQPYDGWATINGLTVPVQNGIASLTLRPRAGKWTIDVEIDSDSYATFSHRWSFSIPTPLAATP